MPGRMTTPLQVIGDQLKASVEAKLRVLVNTFCYVGEQCIIEAREAGNYTDQTGNLRSSIGYAVIWDGKVVQRDCIDKIKQGDKGVSDGNEYLSKCIKGRRRKGIVLIVTAGMNYAEYVEAKGFNVLTSAELKAGPLVKSLLTRLGFRIRT